MVRKARAKKPKAVKKPRAKKSVNSNVNKISININTGRGVGGRRKRNKNAVSGESTGGLSGPDNNASGVTAYLQPYPEYPWKINKSQK